MIRSVGVSGTRGARGLHDLGHREGELAQPLPRGRADREDLEPSRLEVGPDDVGHLAAVGYVDLVERDQPRAVVEPAVRRELVLDDREVVVGVASGLDGDGVDHVHDGGAALDVAEELVAQPAALARALDQAGHVGHGERGVAGGDHTEVGDQRRERVVGDLGARPRDRGDQARLAGARVADQADVGDDLELEHDLQLVAGLAEEREAGRLALGAGQRRVAEAAAAALGDDELGAGADQVGEQLARGGGHHGAVGDRQHQVGAVGAAAVGAGTVAAVLGRAVGAVVVVEERGHVGVDPEDHRAARAAVAAVGAAERLELLTMDRGDAVAAPPRGDVQRHPVDERRHGHDCS